MIVYLPTPLAILLSYWYFQVLIYVTRLILQSSRKQMTIHGCVTEWSDTWGKCCLPHITGSAQCPVSCPSSCFMSSYWQGADDFSWKLPKRWSDIRITVVESNKNDIYDLNIIVRCVKSGKNISVLARFQHFFVVWTDTAFPRSYYYIPVTSNTR